MSGEIRHVGKLVDVAWRGAGEGRCILRVQDNSGGAFHAICQNQALYVGERVVLAGYWSSHPPPAAIFHAQRVDSSPPTDSRGLIRYVAQALDCDGQAASKIVSHFGDRTSQVLDETPERLHEIDNLDEHTVMEMEATWKAARLHHRARSIMTALGLTDGQARELERLFAGDFERLSESLAENPYLAFIFDERVRFAPIDAYAKQQGFDGAAAVRVKALIMRRIRRLCRLGHTFVPTANLIERLSAQLRSHRLTEEAITGVVDELVEDTRLARIGQRVYLPPLYQAELRGLEALQRLIAGETIYESAIDWAGVDRAMMAMGRPAIPADLHATFEYVLATTVGLLHIARGPDDDALAALAYLLDGLSVNRCVLSTEAQHADALNQAHTGLEATCLAQALAYDDDGIAGVAGDAPIKADIVIVAHADQLGIETLRDLCVALPTGCGLILIGDGLCLPSLAPGSPYHDLMSTGFLHSHAASHLMARESLTGHIARAIQEPALAHDWIDSFDAPVSVLNCPDEALASMLDDIYETVLPALGGGSAHLVVPSLAASPGTNAVRAWLAGQASDKASDGPGLVQGETAVVVEDIPSQNLFVGHRVQVVTSEGQLVVQRVDAAGGAQDEQRVISEPMAARLIRDRLVSPSMLLSDRRDHTVLVLGRETSAMLAQQVMLYTVAASARQRLIVIGDSDTFLAALARPRASLWSGFEQLIREDRLAGAA